ncbi:response regulator [Vibrio sp. T187]|uniref:HD domain-containing phosphohydrolase n=1 Tax=Vibrio TaxID=662 RepID=UPI0010C9AB2F|nr:MULTISPECIES: HD domain-containing phosphohydrolase [Vibrio]MBW3696028.1 response regulator [Vibrio sp. T187]
MDKPILLVDDEINILNSFRRTLRNHVSLDLANSGEEALKLIAKKQYAVVISDMKMPEMNGLELLQAVQELSPDTVRMMFTGNADQKTAVDAVNIGDVFRFINKPCSPDELLVYIKSAIHQYDLIVAEKVLLNKTLKGVISVLNEVLSLVNPEISEHNSRIQYHMGRLAKTIKLKPHWSFEPMVQLSQLGYIIFPESTLKSIHDGKQLSEEDQQYFTQHATLAADLIRRIPRMGTIANAIQYQDKGFNGEGLPEDELKGKELPLGARMLKIVCDYTRLEKAKVPALQAIETLSEQKELYDPTLFTAFKTTLTFERPVASIGIADLAPEMVLNQELRTDRGQLVASKGQKVTDALINIIRHCLRNRAMSWDAQVSIIEAEVKEPTKLQDHQI